MRALTYNILAPVFARPSGSVPGDFAYFECSSERDLAWEQRGPLIRALLQDAEADVITLQEVQFERHSEADDWNLPQILQLPGFDWVIPQHSAGEWNHQMERNERVLNNAAVTGVATLFRASKFELVGSETTSRCLAVFLKFHADEEILANERLCVVNVHLEGHPDLHELRRKQLMSAVKKRRKVPAAHLLVMGDFNSVGDEVDRFNEAEHHLQHVRTGPTWSSGRSTAVLDHILAEHSLDIVGHTEFFAEHDHGGMPNSKSGSDHAPIAIEFRIKPRPPPEKEPTLTPEAKQQIAQQWAKVEKPPKVVGKPNADQLKLLQAFAARKKEFLAQYEGLELAHAKKITKK